MKVILLLQRNSVTAKSNRAERFGEFHVPKIGPRLELLQPRIIDTGCCDLTCSYVQVSFFSATPAGEVGWGENVVYN